MSTHCYQPNRDRHTSQHHRVIEEFGTTEASPPKWRVHDPWETLKRQFSREEFQFEVTWMLLWSEIWTHDFNWHVAFSGITVTPFLSWAMRHQQAIFFLEYGIIFPGRSWSWRARRGRWKETNSVLFLYTDEQRTECEEDAFYSCIHFEFVLTLFHLFFPCHYS